MRYFLTDLRGNPIYSFAHARRLRRTQSVASGGNSNSNNNNTNSNSNSNLVGLGGIGIGIGISNSVTINHTNDTSRVDTDTTTTNTLGNTNSNTNDTSNSHHYQSSSNYIRRGSYSQQSRRSSSTIVDGSYTPYSGGTNSTRTSNSNSTSSASVVNSRELFILIRNRSWNEVDRRLRKYPNEASAYDPISGNTALHLACRLDPPASIIYLLKINCRIPNTEGATPLHIAASHRCSKHAIEALLHVCREMQYETEQQQQQQQQNLNDDDDDDDDDVDDDNEIDGRDDRYELYDNNDDFVTACNYYNNNDKTNKNRRHRQRSVSVSIPNTTATASSSSATADLSRMGRAPIHYACMSFRGLEIDAFQVLLDATIRDGNLWMEEPESFSQRHGLNYDNYNDHDDMDDYIDEDDEIDASLNEDENEHENEDENEDERHDEKSISTTSKKLLDGGNSNDKNDRPYKTNDKYLEAEYEQRDDDGDGIESSTINGKNRQGQQQQRGRRILVNVMGLKDGTGQTPLALLFRRYRERVRCVINTLDRLRREHANDPQKMALTAAITVHSDLGQLWEKARWIVARLTAERIANNDDNNTSNTNTRPSDFGFVPATTNHRSTDDGLHSPGEAAVAQEAALWSMEQQALYRLINTQHTSMTMPLLGSDEENNHDGQQRNLEETVTLQTDASSGMSLSSSNDERDTGRQQHRKFRIVHASVGLTGYGCPPELIRLAISIYPHQVAEMDENGNLPLHIAATAASHLAPTMAVAVAQLDHGYGYIHQQSTSSTVGDDHSSVISDAAMSFFSSATVSQTSNPFDKVIKMLLQQYPQAARIPHGRNGQLPLVMAVECGRRTWEDGLRTLLHAYPPALHNKKLILEPSCYPQILSLVANNGTLTSNTPVFGTIDGLPLFDLTYQSSIHHHHHHSGIGSGGGGYGGRSISSFGNAPLHLQSKSTRQQKRRQEAYSRTTLFDLLRTKPEWVTRGLEDDDNHNVLHDYSTALAAVAAAAV